MFEAKISYYNMIHPDREFPNQDMGERRKELGSDAKILEHL